jgi:cation diffusion facilitator family transporter
MRSMDASVEAAAIGRRAVVRGIVTNLALAVVKCLAGIVGHSYALVADGVESLSDVVSSLIAYLGLSLAARPADANHPYGHGKAEPLAALVIALALLVAAVLIAVQSIQEIRTPHELPAPFTLVMLIGVVVVKTILSRYSGRVAATIDSTAVRGDAAHHLSDAITSALAFVGISVGLWTRIPQADDWAALCAVPIITFNAIRQVRAPLAELLDTAPPALEPELRAIAAHVPGVWDIDKCLVRKMGLQYYVDLHVMVDGAISVDAGHEIAHRVKRAIQDVRPRVADALVHIEPATRSSGPT